MSRSHEMSRDDLRRHAKQASRSAIRKAAQKDVPFAVQQGKRIIKVFPDGHKEVVGHLDKAFVRISKKTYSMS